MAWPNTPTFGFQKLSIAQFGLTDGSEPILTDAARCANDRLEGNLAGMFFDLSVRLRPIGVRNIAPLESKGQAESDTHSDSYR